MQNKHLVILKNNMWKITSFHSVEYKEYYVLGYNIV
jgi:hypothetical protein